MPQPGAETDREAAAGGSLRPYPAIALKLAIGAGLLALLFTAIDFPELWRRLAAVDPLCFAAAVALMMVQLAIYAVRLHVMAAAAGGYLPLGQAVIANFELMFFTQAVPTQLAGDAVRALRARKCGMSWPQAITAILLDRVVGVSVMLLVAPLLLLAIPDSGRGQVLLALGALLAVAAAGLGVLYHAGSVLKRLEHWRAVRLAIRASEAFRLLLARPRDLARAALASVAGHACSGLAASVLAAGLALDLPVWPAVAAMALVQIAVLLPLSIGGWGVREGAFVVVMSLLGLSATDALAVSILYGLATLVTGLAGGAVWLACGYRTQEIRAAPGDAAMAPVRPSD
ncbi:MAG: lysylphosphatidylglycerol synthase transmembrane domain-containing protein [Hyphomicrobiales bacterium]